MSEPFKPFCHTDPHFDGKCKLSPLDDGRRWQVEETFSYHDGELAVTVPAFLITDLASVPRCLWAIYPPFGTYTRAAIVHDVLYRQHSHGRAVCDGIFLDCMRRPCGTGWFTRYTLWAFVRLFGWSVFNRKRKERQ